MWKWFNPLNLMDTVQEWHAFVEGFADGFIFFRNIPYWPSDTLLKDLQSEHHYYNAGRALGFASFIMLIAGMVVWITCRR